MSVLDVFQSLENTGFAVAFKDSPWAFAVTESVHLLALSVMGGTVLLVDLRILGLGLTSRPLRELAAETRGWMTVALLALIVTGIGLFLSEAVKCYYSTPFWVKMSTLLVATVFTYTIRQRAVMSAAPEASVSGKAIAVLSMVMWFVVAASGRWIGYSG